MKYSIKKPKIILVSYPAQGHVTPMLKLATIFLTRGIQPVMVIPEATHRQILSSRVQPKDGIAFVAIPDDIDEHTPRDFFSIEAAMENHMPRHLERLIAEFEEDGEVILCMVIDLLASSAIGVANRCGIPATGFWPAMLATYCLISAIPDMVQSGLISETGLPRQTGKDSFLPIQPPLSTEELPWLIGSLAARKARFKFWSRTLSRSRTLKWVLVNSFPDEHNDPKIQQSLIKTSRNGDHGGPITIPIGPLCSLASDSKSPSFWEEDTSCIDWLKDQKPGSAIYVSFGSWVSPIGEAKVKSLAMALESLGKPYLWVISRSWRSGLPIGYSERVSKRGIGKVVSWAPQMEVLKHEAIGCYLTHCGWNSTMEAIQTRKRLVCYPIAGDQFLNCRYIVSVWKIGVEIGGLGVRDVEEGVRKAVEDTEMGNRMKMMYERTMGDEARSTVVSNLSAFFNDVQDGTPMTPPICYYLGLSN